jgi:peroxiredoxin
MRTRSRSALLSAVLAGAAVLVSAGCSSTQQGSAGPEVLSGTAATTDGAGAGASASGESFVGGTGLTTRIAAGKRQAAPELTGKDLQGKALQLSGYRGKVVVMNIWGSWCDPCRAEAKGLEQVYRATEAQGVRFVGINTQDLQIANAKAFESSYKITYPSLFDPSGKLILKFPKGTVNPQAIPSTLIIDRQGKIAVRILHAVGEDELGSLVRSVAAEK